LTLCGGTSACWARWVDGYDDETLTAIRELIALGEQEGFGITFEPDPAG
jgi:hypothetical protein